MMEWVVKLWDAYDLPDTPTRVNCWLAVAVLKDRLTATYFSASRLTGVTLPAELDAFQIPGGEWRPGNVNR
jgi:hypothetical protein